MTLQGEKPAFRRYSAKTGEKGFNWDCPGCGRMHSIPTEGHPRVNWEWDGDAVAPTFAPSVRVRFGQGDQCHFFIRDGVAEFCGDCTHEYSGHKLPVVPLP